MIHSLLHGEEKKKYEVALDVRLILELTRKNYPCVEVASHVEVEVRD